MEIVLQLSPSWKKRTDKYEKVNKTSLVLKDADEVGLVQARYPPALGA